MDWEEDEDKEPEEALVMGFDMGMDWENVDDEEPELIFPYQIEGPPYPPPPASPDTKPVEDNAGFQALSAAQETARVENIKLRIKLEEAQMSNALLCMDLRRTQRNLREMTEWAYDFYVGMLRIVAVGVRPSNAIDVLAVYGESQPPGPQGTPSGSRVILFSFVYIPDIKTYHSRLTMPPRRLRGATSTKRSKRAAMEKLIADRVAEVIAEHKQNRPNPANAERSENVQGCSHKTFMNGKPHPFNGTEGVVGLRRWIEKIEQFRVELQELVRVTKGSRKSVKEIPITITLIITTTTIETTTPITNNQTEGKKLPEPMLQPQLRIGVMLEIYPCATVSTHITMVNSLQNFRGAKEPNIKRRIVGPDFHVQMLPLYKMWFVLVIVKRALQEQVFKERNQQNEGARTRAYVVVENPQQNLNVVTGERPKKDPRLLSCIKADEKKIDDIRIVRDFPKVFPDDFSGLPPMREIEFRIDLIPGSFPVVKSPYRLSPSEIIKLSNQLKELQEKGFIKPSHSP
nr:putative reverse transcriptase domain-containing protein [Tanacetum cinerariifolium]